MEQAEQTGRADVLVGCGFGDDGKGIESIRRVLANIYWAGVRFNGGSNAGHERGDITLHQIPSSVGEVEYCLLANGSLVDPELLHDEFADVYKELGVVLRPNNFGISDTAHLVLPHHKILDGIRESGEEKQGSTKKGIAFVAADKYGRRGVRGELLTWDPDIVSSAALKGLHLANQALQEAGKSEVVPEEEFERWLAAAQALIPFMVDSIPLLHQKLKEGKDVFLEGAQAIGLDMEFGIYPLNTSSHAGVGGALNGTGINHHYLRDIIGVAKLPGTRVGGEKGRFLTKIPEEQITEDLRGRPGEVDFEQGKTTKRDRDIGYPDVVMMRHAVEVAGITEMVLTKLDKLRYIDGDIKVAVAYDMNGERRLTLPNSARKLNACEPKYETFKNWKEDLSDVRDFNDLPGEAQKLVKFIEEELEVPVTTLGVGPQRDQVIYRHHKVQASEHKDKGQEKAKSAVR